MGRSSKPRANRSRTQQRARRRTAAARASRAPRTRNQRRARARATDRILYAVGCVLLLVGVASVVIAMLPGLAATLRSGGAAFVVDPAPVHVRNWVLTVGLLASLIGFNLAYFGATDARRRPTMAVFLALFAAGFVFVAWSALWMAGTERAPDTLFEPDATGGAGVAGLLGMISVLIAATGIMCWLGGNSTFDDQREEYFGAARGTRVTIRRIAVRPHVYWIIGLLVLWLTALAPVYLAGPRESAYSASIGRPTHAWPLPLLLNDQLAPACALVGSVFAGLWGISLSFLVQKLLYAGPLADYADRFQPKVRPTFGEQLIRLVRHWPIPVGAVILTAVLANAPGSGGAATRVLTALAVFVVLAALGVWLISQTWRSRSMTHSSLRLNRAQPAYQ